MPVPNWLQRDGSAIQLCQSWRAAALYLPYVCPILALYPSPVQVCIPDQVSWTSLAPLCSLYSHHPHPLIVCKASQLGHGRTEGSRVQLHWTLPISLSGLDIVFQRNNESPRLINSLLFLHFLPLQFGYTVTVLECDQLPQSVNTDRQTGLWWFSFVDFIF